MLLVPEHHLLLSICRLLIPNESGVPSSTLELANSIDAKICFVQLLTQFIFLTLGTTFSALFILGNQ